jgi:hypothetical protein
MSNKFTPKNVEQGLRTFRGALAKVLPAGKTMFLRQQNQDGTTIGGLVDAALAPFDAANTSEKTWKAAVTAKHANEPAAEQLYKDLEEAARVTFKDTSAEFEALGFTPRKNPVALTADEKAAKLAKMRQTKAARGELGKGSRKKKKAAPNTPPSSGTGK